MKNYAQMAGNYVSNIIVAENKQEVEEMLSCTLIEIAEENPAGVGFIYDSESGFFINPSDTIEEPLAAEAPVE